MDPRLHPTLPSSGMVKWSGKGHQDINAAHYKQALMWPLREKEKAETDTTGAGWKQRWRKARL